MKNKRKEIDQIIKELNKKGYNEKLVERLEELEMEMNYYPDKKKGKNNDKI